MHLIRKLVYYFTVHMIAVLKGWWPPLLGLGYDWLGKVNAFKSLGFKLLKVRFESIILT